MGPELLATALGLALLVAGAESLVRGASRLATKLGVPPLVVGLTVVAFGTSSPELAVSVAAALDDRAGLALGNVVGSNIFNVLVVLGLSAIVTPLAVDRKLVRLDVPLMIAASAAVLLLALDGRIGRAEGGVLVAGILAYAGFLVREVRRSPSAPASATPTPGWSVLAAAAASVAGLVLLTLGSRSLVSGATGLARRVGVSELLLGLTVIAVGTSLPEAATSLVAALRGERDLAVGNVVGSNLFNLLAVLGGAALLSPRGIPVPPEALRFDLPVMLAVAVACLPVAVSGSVVDRWEGGVFLAFYVAYVGLLALAALHHPALGPARVAVLGSAAALGALTLGSLVRRSR